MCVFCDNQTEETDPDKVMLMECMECGDLYPVLKKPKETAS
jgi:translation initiation factor 2 beta subunit (eIF-2beta)/eIF-5